MVAIFSIIWHFANLKFTLWLEYSCIWIVSTITNPVFLLCRCWSGFDHADASVSTPLCAVVLFWSSSPSSPSLSPSLPKLQNYSHSSDSCSLHLLHSFSLITMKAQSFSLTHTLYSCPSVWTFARVCLWTTPRQGFWFRLTLFLSVLWYTSVKTVYDCVIVVLLSGNISNKLLF